MQDVSNSGSTVSPGSAVLPICVPLACLVLVGVLAISPRSFRTAVASRPIGNGGTAAGADAVDLQITDWQGVERLVDTHRGRVVLLDIWTTTCPACIEEFPQFAALQERLGKERVVLISVCCDYDGIEGKPPEYYRPDVEQFLTEQGADFQHVLLNVALLEFMNQIDLESTPTIFVYGTDGTLVRRFDNAGAFTEDEMYKMDDVAQLAAELSAQGG